MLKIGNGFGFALMLTLLSACVSDDVPPQNGSRDTKLGSPSDYDLTEDELNRALQDIIAF